MYECQIVEYVFTSPVIIESVSVVYIVLWCSNVVFLGAMYMLCYGDALEVFCVYFEKLYFYV